MNIFRLLIGIVVCFGLTVFSIYPQTKDAQGLEQALHQMEAAGKGFRSFTAQFVQQRYTAVLNEFDPPESGELDYALAPDGSALIRMEYHKPGLRILTIKGGLATLYQPSINQAQIANLGKNKNKAEYLVLGIGQSPAKLQQTYSIQYQGTEAVNGAACWVLLLTPKPSTGVAAMFSAVTLWVKKSSGIPIKDKLQDSGNKNYTLITFSNEQLNKPIPASRFEQKLPPGVEKQVIQ